MNNVDATFRSHHNRLFGIAYRMLGSANEAEDIVQDAWIRWNAEQAHVEQPGPWLARVVTRLSIDRLRANEVRRRDYLGPWLPEPILHETTPDAPIELAESLTFAFLLLLDQLSPVERAVYLLRAAFDVDYDDIAATVHKTPTNCRQIFARARKRLASGRRPGDAPVSEPLEAHQPLLHAFAHSIATGNIDALVGLLQADVTFTSDGGGKVAAATKPVRGAQRVAKFLIGISRFATTQTTWTSINGQCGAVVHAGAQLLSVMIFELNDGHIARIHMVRNPDKLQAIVHPRIP